MIVFLDACAIIYWMEGAAPWSDRLNRTLIQLRKVHNDPPVAASALSRLECCVKPMRERDAALLRRYDRFFDQPELVRVPVNDQVLQIATQLRAESGLATPDAIQAASALSLAGETVFVTNDNRLKTVQELDIVRI